MMLNTQIATVSTIPVVTEPLVLHPVEVRQLRLRQDELSEEVVSGTLIDDREALVAELSHVREILSRFDQGNASVTRRAGLAA